MARLRTRAARGFRRCGVAADARDHIPMTAASLPRDDPSEQAKLSAHGPRHVLGASRCPASPRTERTERVTGPLRRRFRGVERCRRSADTLTTPARETMNELGKTSAFVALFSEIGFVLLHTPCWRACSADTGWTSGWARSLSSSWSGFTDRHRRWSPSHAGD